MLDTPFFNWVIMPLLIVIARLFDVGLSTLRAVFTMKGEKLRAAIVGFFEVLIWLIIIRQLFIAMDNPLWYIAYALGFALGTYLGLVISEQLSIGNVGVRVVTRKHSKDTVNELRDAGYSITTIPSRGKHGPSIILYSAMHSGDVQRFIGIVERHHPNAFYTIEDVRKISAMPYRGAIPFLSRFRISK